MSTYWNNEGKYEQVAQSLNDLMPGFGKCETLKGEIWRAASKIYYDYYNNGFGNTWHSPAAFLMDHVEDLPQSVKKVLLEHGLGNIAHADYEEEMEMMIDSTIEYLQGVDDRNNDCDMWQYRVSSNYIFDELDYGDDEDDWEDEDE